MAEILMACPICKRALRPVPLMSYGTQVVTRKCRCGKHWQLVVEPMRKFKGGWAHKLTWAQIR